MATRDQGSTLSLDDKTNDELHQVQNDVGSCPVVSPPLPDLKQEPTAVVAESLQASLSCVQKGESIESAISVHSLDSQRTSLKNVANAVGRPSKKRKFSILDSIAVLTSLICLIIGVIIVSPSLAVSWRMGFQEQIIAIGFLIGVMNLCAERVVPSSFLAVEARYGRSRLQNFDAILANKFLSPNVSLYWRVAMILFLGLPLALSVGYKQFLGGTSTTGLKPLPNSTYGLAYPIIGDWTPLNDPIYLEISSSAAYHTASANDTPILNGSNQYPIAYGYNVLLLSDNSAALLDLPTNEYLDTIRSKFNDGEEWQLSAPINAYVAARNTSAADAVRSNDTYWEAALNASTQGLTSYWLAQDANTYIGMLPVVGQASCWMAVYKGGPSTEDMYSKSLSDANVYGFRQSAELFSLRRQRCHATWQISASAMRLLHGNCDDDSDVEVSQSSLVGDNESSLFTPTASSSLPHIFWQFVIQRPDSPWLMPTYAVTTATCYWARAVYMAAENQIGGYTYAGTDEEVLSTRKTLNALPGLFICLAFQPVLTVAAFLVKSTLFLPLGSGFGLIAVLAGIKRSTLDIVAGAGFSGELRRPVKLGISVSEPLQKELGGAPSAVVNYELKAESSERCSVRQADGKTVYS